MEYKSMNIRVRATGDDAEEILALLGETDLNVTVITREIPTEEELGLLEELGTKMGRKVSKGEPFAEDRSHSRWDCGEEAILMGRILNGVSVEEAAMTLGRSLPAIKSRLNRLGISFQKVSSDRTVATLVDGGCEVTDIDVKNEVLRHFIHSFVKANRGDYGTVTACLEAAAEEVRCPMSIVKRIHYNN